MAFVTESVEVALKIAFSLKNDHIIVHRFKLNSPCWCESPSQPMRYWNTAWFSIQPHSQAQPMYGKNYLKTSLQQLFYQATTYKNSQVHAKLLCFGPSNTHQVASSTVLAIPLTGHVLFWPLLQKWNIQVFLRRTWLDNHLIAPQKS